MPILRHHAVAAKTSGKILEDQPEEGIHSYGGKTEKRKVLRREWEISASTTLQKMNRRS